MPAVMMRQLDALYTIMERTADADIFRVLMDQAEMIQRANLASVLEASQQTDVERRYGAVASLYARLSS